MIPDMKPKVDFLSCSGIGKRYSFEWVFKDFDYSFKQGECYAIQGPNGSGKSTLLKILSGHSTPSKGTVEYSSGSAKITVGDIFSYIAFAAPYIELIDVLTVDELLVMHHGLRPFEDLEKVRATIKNLPFKNMGHKKVEELSSGMKQRLKLILAIMTRSSIILLDEPGSNMDEEGKQWFEDLLKPRIDDHIVIIASNEESDLRLAAHSIKITDYKKVRQA